MSDVVAELDQVLPVARALAEQDAKLVATFYSTLKAEIECEYDVLPAHGRVPGGKGRQGLRLMPGCRRAPSPSRFDHPRGLRLDMA
jgi:hypothetical protein